MNYVIAKGLFIPFIGTSLGALCVLFLKRGINRGVQKVMTGFAAGVMVAASVWSLIIPSIEQSRDMGRLSFIPAVCGFCIGMIFLLILDKITPHMHIDESIDGPNTKLKKNTMLVLAVVIHNIPEGMAVGVVFAGLVGGKADISVSGAMALAFGIAIQNFPEGAIVSMPLAAEGKGKGKAALLGVLSGAVEPIAGVLTILLSRYIIPVLPYLLSFAAGAMIYVVVEELVPEMSEDGHSDGATVAFMLGFCIMMILDVALN